MTTATKQPASLDRLFAAGAHFAQLKSRRHPSMKPFIIGAKSRVEIFDLAKTEEQLEAAKAALTALATAGKTVLFVGGKQEASVALRETASKLHQPYVSGRWLGGTISNFTEIKKRIDRLADLTGKRESGELVKSHTKLERLFIDREIDRLTHRLDGIVSLTKRPDALVVVDTRHEAHAIREAKAAGIPVIALMSSDCDLKDATYPIVVNDASRTSIALVLGELAAAFSAGQRA